MAAPLENTNAEKYTEQIANDLFDKAILIANQGDKDFIGEVAVELNLYHEIFVYLVDKFPDLKHKYKQLIARVEANCFSNAKDGRIKESIAIVNLKSNHNWTDRQRIDQTTEHKGGINIITDPEMNDEINRVSDRTD